MPLESAGIAHAALLIMRTLIKLRKMDRQKRMEEEELLEVYKQAIGLTV